MSGQCNYCGGEHAEDGCDAPRELVFSNGLSAGIANGHNMRQPQVEALRTALEVAVREIVATRKEREAFFDNSRYDVWKDSVKRAGETSVATDANPIASAAIKKAREWKQ